MLGLFIDAASQRSLMSAACCKAFFQPARSLCSEPSSYILTMQAMQAPPPLTTVVLWDQAGSGTGVRTDCLETQPICKSTIRCEWTPQAEQHGREREVLPLGLPGPCGVEKADVEGVKASRPSSFFTTCK